VTTAPSIQITRHYEALSERETDELVGTVADMLVNFIKSRKDERPKPGRTTGPKAETSTQHTGR